MTRSITVTPAYGRDYTSITAARADWAKGLDFLLQDIDLVGARPRPINSSDADRAGFTVMIRYNRMRSINTAAK
jgi:hypothetical protein